MINLSPSICYKIRDARREAHISQSELAAEIGCKQPALSMFEQGQPTKLNDEYVEKLAKKFKIELVAVKEEASSGARQSSAPRISASIAHTGFCPNPACPSNQRYEVEGRVMFLPDREKADPVGGRFCAYCGEVLERKCPSCGAPVHAGSICSLCGDPYIPFG